MSEQLPGGSNEQPGPVELLLQAANLIETYGWVQGRMGNAAYGFCMSGAMDHCFWSNHGYPDDSLIRAISSLQRVVGPYTVSWNDTQGRTKEEVTAALRKAAELVALTPVTVEPDA